jgi:hypothetical protein
LLPLLLTGALAGLATAPAAAQNMCSPSTATATRYAGYPGSSPYSNSGTRITSNCTGPNVDAGVSPDPYAGMVFPVPGYVYGSTSGAPVLGGYSQIMAPSSYAAPSAAGATDPSAYASSSSGAYAPASDPSALYGAAAVPSSLGGYPYGGASPYGLAAGYPAYGGLGAVGGLGYPLAGPYSMGGYGYPGLSTAGYGYPAPYGAGYGAAPGYAPYPYPAGYWR